MLKFFKRTPNPISLVLSRAQHTRVDALLDELLDLPEAQRAAHLKNLLIDDSQVRDEVASLLRASVQSRGFMATPARPLVDETPEDDALIAGMRFGAWRVLGLIGRGGMGEVYEAKRAQSDFDQRVAIKLLRHEASAQSERFEAERQILARLDHPGIARLFDGGVSADGRPYMVIEFVEGEPVTNYCERTHATLAHRLQLFIAICDAVQYAHRNLVIHRDLKPSNILVSAIGQVKLLDFGVAKLLDDHRGDLTQATLAPLTPRCAAPEQLSGEPITTATDVYALGLLLFELLTGKHAWMETGTPVFQALQIILKRPAHAPSHIAESIDDAPVAAKLIRGDLDAIVAKALRVEPARRYATVEAMQMDVIRTLRGEPVSARDGARLYVFQRMLRRYRWAAAGIAIVVLSLAGGLGVAAYQAKRAQIERDTARRDAAREEAMRYNLTSLFRSAIADQHAQSATAKGMIDASAGRVLREYHDQPVLAGQIVLTLADLYGALEDVEGAGALLDGFVAQAGPDADPVALADARQKLANIDLLRGQPDRARALLDQAQTFWEKFPGKYREERLEALGIRAKLQRVQGDVSGAIATSREAIEQRVALSGRNDRETAILYNSLGITLMSANRLNEALDAYRETINIYRAIGLADGLDAQIILANIGTLEFRLGHLRDAETLLGDAIGHERALAGDSAAVAAAMGYFGKVLSVRNEASAAKVLHEAVDLATRYAGPNSPVSLQNRIYFGEAQLASDDVKGAHETLVAAHDAALRQYGDAHVLTLRTQLALAQADAASGQIPQAALDLGAVIAKLGALGKPAQTNLAQALIALADMQMTLGKTQTAIDTLRAGITLFEQSNAPAWELARARERLGEALTASGDKTHSLPLLRDASHALETELGTDHPQTIRARSALARL